MEPGHFYAEDLGEVREKLFYQGHIPRVIMGHKGGIHRLTVAIPEGKCVIHHIDPETSKSIAALLDAFGLEYTGQPLPAATQTVLFELLKPKREHLSKKERDELYEEQGGKCENCASALDNSEADHVSHLRDLVAGQDQMFRLLCPTCHSEVSEPTQR